MGSVLSHSHNNKWCKFEFSFLSFSVSFFLLFLWIFVSHTHRCQHDIVKMTLKKNYKYNHFMTELIFWYFIIQRLLWIHLLGNPQANIQSTQEDGMFITMMIWLNLSVKKVSIKSILYIYTYWIYEKLSSIYHSHLNVRIQYADSYLFKFSNSQHIKKINLIFCLFVY